MENRIFIDRNQIAKRFKPRPDDAHKGTLGHALIVAGSYGKIGAAVLSAKAAMHAGCGLVTAYLPKCGYDIMQTSIPEVMIITDDDAEIITSINPAINYQSIAIGPGIGTNSPTQKALLEFLKQSNKPLVLDADALNIIAMSPSEISIPENSIVTPHAKELERLVGSFQNEAEKLAIASAFSIQHNVIVVVKGSPTYIIDKHAIYRNTTGNSALATAGSGDVLTGIIGGLLAQQYSSLDATLIAVYLHGLSADIAVAETSREAFVASDIIKYLGRAFRSLAQK